MDKNIFYNGSGIKDPTAYKAIMVVEDMSFMRGEIYRVETKRGEEKFALIVSADFRKDDKVVSVIFLSDECKNNDDVIINCFGLKYAPPSGVQYLFSDTIGEFVKRATSLEMDDVDRKISRYLGLPFERECVKEVANKAPAASEFPDSSHPIIPKELIEARTEARIYKDLCDRLIAGRK